MPDEITEFNDDVLTAEQALRVSSLSPKEVGFIDQSLLHSASVQWQKVAMVVAKAMGASAGRLTGVPDVYFSQRVRELVVQQALESQGNLLRMRFSEVRLPAHASET